MAIHLIYSAVVGHVRTIFYNAATNVHAKSLLLKGLWLHCHSDDVIGTYAISDKCCSNVHIGPDTIRQTLLAAHYALSFYGFLCCEVFPLNTGNTSHI